MSSFWDGFITGAADQLKTEIEESQERVQRRADRIAEFQMTQFQEARKLNKRKREEAKEITKAIAATLGGDKQALVAAASIVSQGDLYAKEAYKVLLESKLAGDDPRKFIGEIPDMGLEGKDITVEDIAKSIYPEATFDFTVPKESSGSIFDKVFGGSVEGRVEERIKEGRSMGILPEESDGKGAAPSAFPGVPSVPVDFGGIYKARKARTRSGTGSGKGISFSSAMGAHKKVVDQILGKKYVIDNGNVYLKDQGKMISISPGHPDYQQFIIDRSAAEQQATITIRPLIKPNDLPSFDTTFPFVENPKAPEIDPEGFDPKGLGVTPVPVGKN